MRYGRRTGRRSGAATVHRRHVVSQPYDVRGLVNRRQLRVLIAGVDVVRRTIHLSDRFLNRVNRAVERLFVLCRNRVVLSRSRVFERRDSLSQLLILRLNLLRRNDSLHLFAECLRCLAYPRTGPVARVELAVDTWADRFDKAVVYRRVVPLQERDVLLRASRVVRSGALVVAVRAATRGKREGRRDRGEAMTAAFGDCTRSYFRMRGKGR
jgi:hypothetical protein